MDHKEMLQKMGLTEEQHRDLTAKIAGFLASLDDKQRRVIRKTMPNAEEVARSFGKGATVEDLHKLTHEAFFADFCCCYAGGDDE